MNKFKPQHQFIDVVAAELGCNTDAALADKLGFNYALISCIRHGRLVPSDEMIVSAHVETGMPIKLLKQLREQAEKRRKV